MKRKRSRSTFEIFESIDDTFEWRVVETKKGESQTIATSDAAYGTAKKARRAINELRTAAVDVVTDPEPAALPASRLRIDRSSVPLRMQTHRPRRKRDKQAESARSTQVPAEKAIATPPVAVVVAPVPVVTSPPPAPVAAPPAPPAPAAKPAAAPPLGARAAKRAAAKKGAAKPRLGARAAKRAAAKKAAAKKTAAKPAAKPSAP